MYESCDRCLYDSRHPFGFTTVNGICSGCITHEEKDTIDWGIRQDLFKQGLTSTLKKHGKRTYDCVVPVQGDAEDYYVVSLVLELGLSPLIVCVNDYFKNDIGWYNLHNLITYFDLDSLIYNPEIVTYKALITTCLRKFDHMYWPTIALNTSFPVHVAYDKNIPLVIWGQHQAIEQVGKFSHYDSVEMTSWSREEHDLFNYSVKEVIGTGAHVSPKNLKYYKYLNSQALQKRGVRGHYLSNYFRWDPFQQNQSVTNFGYSPQQNYVSFDPYERAGSSVYYKIHDLLKMKRLGYRKVRDHLVREIRHERLSLNEAREIEKSYTENKVDINPFFDWLGVTKTGREWFIKHKLREVQNYIGAEISNTLVKLPKNLSSSIAPSQVPTEEFILFGKGL